MRKYGEADFSKLFRSAVDSIGDALILCNIKGEIIYSNPSAEKLFNISKGGLSPELSPRGFEVYFADKKTPLEKNETPLSKALQGERVDNFYLFFKSTKQKRELSLSVSSRPLYDEENNEITGCLSIFRDTTLDRPYDDTLKVRELLLQQDVSQSREALQKAEKQLKHLQKREAIGRLAAGVAHDFNNILGIVNLVADQIQEEMPESEKLKKRNKQIQDVIKKGAALTRQLLTFSRNQSLKNEPLLLNEVIKDFSKLLVKLVDTRVEIKLDLTDETPYIVGDKNQIEQVIMNLVINARDAIPESGRILIRTENIRVSNEHIKTQTQLKPGEYVALKVSDDGEGISNEHMDKIFDPFFTTKDPHKGTGLGLSTVYGIVKQHGGSIKFESHKDSGTTFTVYLPTSSAKPNLTSEEKSFFQRTLNKDRIQNTRVLVAEDEAILRELLNDGLSSFGLMVIGAKDGSSALAEAKRYSYRVDLLITDMDMPGLSGTQLIDHLRVAAPDLRVLLISGYSSHPTEEIVKLKKKYPNRIDFLEKPFTVPQLLEKVQNLLLQS
jgi:PAS domain S-box-containing protein